MNPNVTQIRTCTPEIRQVGDPQDRTLEFIGSTADMDRYGDIIEVKGWDLKNYLNNPVFLWAHNYSMPPIGQAVSVKKTDEGLRFQIKFAEYDFADTIYRLYVGGFLRATSVGFNDLEREPIIDKQNEGRQTGWRFLKQELWELSAVPVPANPNALMLAVQKGVISDQEAETFNVCMAGWEKSLAHELPQDCTATVTAVDGAPVSATDNPLPAPEDLEARIAQLETRLAALEGRESPAWLKAFMETQNTLQEVLLGAFGAKLAPATDLYRQLLDPGVELQGDQLEPGKQLMDNLLNLTKGLHALVNPRGD